ncbi:hypothetical protein Pcinc_034438 [Petrolisthes cinctipes]|uniref:Uncharacterized protein n=1 Tax=Petrolisthes cinctipes TaxID=88211 RepID=A0AAE1EQA2_PETCI|nr:hypothetical protein Pcinc_034438 [Petrolisthes cinctipes]
MAEHRMWTVSEEEEGDDGEIDDVFEQGFSPNEHNEEASSCSPSSVIHISHSCVKGAVGGLVPGRLAPQLPVGGLWGSRGVGRAAHTGTSIISHLHPGFLENASPTPPTSPGTELVGLLTLHSLGGGHDSGYIPSPSSACSFTFSSDEEEPVAPGHPRPGVTPPIAIPQTQRRANSHAHRRPARPASPPGTPLLEDITPVRRGRTRSCPEDICALATSRTPVPKFPNSVAATASATPAHGRTCSMPATTPDGKPLLTPQQEYRTPVVTPRPSRDNLIDLSLEDGSHTVVESQQSRRVGVAVIVSESARGGRGTRQGRRTHVATGNLPSSPLPWPGPSLNWGVGKDDHGGGGRRDIGLG